MNDLLGGQLFFWDGIGPVSCCVSSDVNSSLESSLLALYSRMADR